MDKTTTCDQETTALVADLLILLNEYLLAGSGRSHLSWLTTFKLFMEPAIGVFQTILQFPNQIIILWAFRVETDGEVMTGVGFGQWPSWKQQVIITNLDHL